ncbi:MAG: hypothetical protein KDJ41_17465 [Hyphomicrobiaceae bacterium]|nr:hypothetical protein [Hyphomicrobiaceae bacterium]
MVEPSVSDESVPILARRHVRISQTRAVFAGKVLAIRDIKSFEIVAVSVSNRQANLVAGAVFAVLALLIAVPVLHELWRPRFMIATVLFGSIAVVAIADLCWPVGGDVYSLHVRTSAGEAMVYSTADEAFMSDVASALATVVRA